MPAVTPTITGEESTRDVVGDGLKHLRLLFTAGNADTWTHGMKIHHLAIEPVDIGTYYAADSGTVVTFGLSGSLAFYLHVWAVG